MMRIVSRGVGAGVYASEQAQSSSTPKVHEEDAPSPNTKVTTPKAPPSCHLSSAMVIDDTLTNACSHRILRHSSPKLYRTPGWNRFIRHNYHLDANHDAHREHRGTDTRTRRASSRVWNADTPQARNPAAAQPEHNWCERIARATWPTLPRPCSARSEGVLRLPGLLALRLDPLLRRLDAAADAAAHVESSAVARAHQHDEYKPDGHPHKHAPGSPKGKVHGVCGRRARGGAM